MNIVGLKFNKWLVLNENGRDKKGCRLYLCECECGVLKSQTYANLKSSITTQCKKCHMEKLNFVDNIIGQSFGAWTVLEKVKNNSRNEWYYKSVCTCGNIKISSKKSLIAGSTTKNHRCIREFHDMSDTDTYKIWHGMHNRCYNSNVNTYKNYGARGIRVCERWHTFSNFVVDMGERPVGLSIDRIDNNGNYEPSNCKWSTHEEQISNRRNSKKIKG